MPSSLIDVCRFNPTAGGTTDWTFSSAVTGYQSPTAAGAVNAAVYSYRAESADLTQWEIGTGAYNSGTGVFARTTVLFNSLGTTAKVSFTAVPQVAIVALAEDLVRSIGGVAGALTVGKGVAISGSDIERSFGEATFQGTATNPASTTNTTGVMMGLGSTFKLTPNFSGRIDLRIQGIVANSVATASCNVQVRWGTGTAPANAAALSGTTLGSLLGIWSPVANASVAFNIGGIITGLTPGTAYWFDIGMAVSTGTGTMASASASAMEF